MTPQTDTDAWLAGLGPRAAFAIRQTGLPSKDAVRDAIESGALSPEFTPQLGARTFLDICSWCGAAAPRRRPPSPKPVATPTTIAKARRTLERAGYTVIGPQHRGTPTGGAAAPSMEVSPGR